MKKIISLILITLSLLFIPVFPIFAQGQSPDWINNFFSEITINQDTSLTIKETIKYQTTIEKHGIYRYIPFKYDRDGKQFVADIKKINITDENGASINYASSKVDNNLILKIGDSNRTFSGQKTYVIEYTVENALAKFEDHDELYWDITGEGWEIPISNSEAKINSNFAKITKIACYSGAFGGTDNLCKSSFENSFASFLYTQTINKNSNLTVVLALDKNNQLQFPVPPPPPPAWLIALQKFGLIALFFLPYLIIYLIWNAKGRDWMFDSPNVFNMDPKLPHKKKPIFYSFRTPFVYEPIKEMTPGEAGMILDDKVDNQDVVAEIIDLARRKYLKIEAETSKGFLGIGSSTDYIFTQLKEADSSLPKQQKYLLDSIFNTSVISISKTITSVINAATGKSETKEEKIINSGGKKQIRLSDLKGNFYDKMAKTKEMIASQLVSRKLYIGNPGTKKGLMLALVIMVNIGMFVFLPFIIVFSQAYWLYLFFVPFAIISFILAINMPQRTAVGTNLMLQAKGLKQAISWGKWREEVKEKNLFIEEILPFAIALGVVDKLAKDMEGLNIQPPDYLNNAMIAGYSWSGFVNDFNKSVVSDLSYNPSKSSSGWSGGSGFSGGSSGGGGGGGGGGSW